jgi:hypothetical protein
MNLRETFGDDYMEAVGDAEFVAWAAKSFHELVALEAARRMDESRCAQARLSNQREQRRHQLVAAIARQFRQVIRDTLESSAFLDVLRS